VIKSGRLRVHRFNKLTEEMKMDFISAAMVVGGMCFLVGSVMFSVKTRKRANLYTLYWCVYIGFILFFIFSYGAALLLSYSGYFVLNAFYAVALLLGTLVVFVSNFLCFVTVEKLKRIEKYVQNYSDLRDLAELDKLTGCNTKAYFLKVLESRYKQIKLDSSRVVILFIELKNLKEIGESMGAKTIDLALKAVGKLLLQRFRRMDVVAYYETGQFVVLMEKLSLDNAKKVAHEITNAIRPFAKQQVSAAIELECFIGVSEISNDLATYTEGLHNAEAACSEAKSSDALAVHVF